MEKEQTEWDAVNRLLQHHGFRPVRFTDPAENKNLADLVLLERTSSSELRATLKTMLTDSERRQALIQELIQSNKKLKQEVEQHQARAVRQSHRAEELEGVLAGVKVKVQGLEDSIINKAAQQRGERQQLQQDKEDAEMRCQAVQQQLSDQVSQVCELQKKLHLAVKEEEKRSARQNQAFQQFLSRSARLHSPSDQLILDVISVYESQLQQLQEKLKRCDRCSVCKRDSSESQNTTEINTSRYRTLLKSYQDQLKKTKAQHEELKSEIQRLRQDLDSRPSGKELKWCKQQLRRMERLVQHTNIKLVQTETTEDPLSSSAETRRHAADTQRYITEICSELKVQDTGHVVAAIKARCREADAALRLEKILSDITAILTKPGAPLALPRQPDDAAGSDLDQIVPTLEMWSRQLATLSDLQRSVNRLVKRLLPWQPEDGACRQGECVTVEDVMLMVDTLLDETAPDDKVLRTPTKPTLQAMLSHFQMLFDVPSLRGVYPRMNEVYTRLEEMNNAMRNLRDILDLDERAPPGDVVNTVARIMSGGGADHHNPHELLGTSDIDSIIVKLREHEEFFPAFHSLVLELLNTLGAESLDDILPRVRTLKSMTE
ncbi:centrosomal protein of 70 kDa isoform 2-T2 [Clarias gariepinus]|uniref:centrosomal protein of 70 kDa isoform X2 n=1 Tax=Clarias gariepinus TaxID=13013 RepID=UPI00234C596A|nr:centrosomal protein of 70 kDa isoform X2 [Clarias gariepinus]